MKHSNLLLTCRIFLFLVFPFNSFAQQLNVKEFGAKGNGTVDDQPAIQKAVDEAVKTSSTVYFPPGNYRIDRPVMVYHWNGKEYTQVFVKLTGESRMWDNGKGSVIIANFKDKFAIGVQKGKGCIISGLNFQGKYQSPNLLPEVLYQTDFDKYGDPSCRDSRYSPYAGIVLDPFTGEIPGDGGYPGMREWYRGPQSRSGSTGIRIEDCTVSNFTIGIILSPNGYTQNNELITIENIRFGDSKAGFAGCQAQEKMNRIINVGAWGRVHTVFVFNKYGAGHPGNYFIQGVNLAGSVINIIYRNSGGWGPMFMRDVFAESILSIGHWDGASGDVLSTSLINFRFPKELGYLPDFHVKSSGLTIQNCTIRYYGELQQPVLLHNIKDVENNTYVPAVNTQYAWQNSDKFTLTQIINPSETQIVKNKVRLPYRTNGKANELKPGDYLIFSKGASKNIVGQGLVESIQQGWINIGYISPSVKSMKDISIYLYRKAEPGKSK